MEAQKATDAATYNAAKDELSGINSLADTPWSELFHAARADKTWADKVGVTVTVEDGRVVTGDVVTMQQGEHYHARNSNKWDGVVTMRTKAFMTVEEAVAFIRGDLQQLAQQKSR